MPLFGHQKQPQEFDETIKKLKDKLSELERENNQIKTMLNSMVEGVIDIDKEKKIITINPAVTKIFDITKEQAEGKFLLEVIRNNDIFEVVDNVLESGQFISKELTLMWPLHKIFKFSASPVLENGEINGCVVVLYDITEIRNLEKIRSEFVANISHELKTPLTSIKGFIETLLAGALEDKENSRHFLKIIDEHAQRLNNLINDLLELAHIESKEIPLAVENINLKGLIDKTIVGFKSQIKKKNINIYNEIAKEVFIKADSAKIERVLINLIDNAIKFNKENGFVKIYCEIPAGQVKVIVEDSGIGIPEKDLPRIFERFYRVDKGRSRELGGTGLGLSIAKHTIELHGGIIGAESQETIGSKFWFILPKV